MKLEILNYDRGNHSHLDWAIALRACVAYDTEHGMSTVESLHRAGFTDSQIHTSTDNTSASVVVLDLTQEQRDALVVERQRIKSIRGGA